MKIFNWFTKTNKQEPIKVVHQVEVQDEIEQSLWEIKEEYDLPTEEIVDVVYSKRNNIDVMRQAIQRINKDKEKL